MSNWTSYFLFKKGVGQLIKHNPTPFLFFKRISSEPFAPQQF